MRRTIAGLCLALTSVSTVFAQVSLDFAVPGARIGVNLGAYPVLERIPGYPVYYAPGVGSNYFFYDGLYWVFDGTNWYASSWYNGPWAAVDPLDVPVYVLRVPVRYYRHPPSYFHGWRADYAPRWGDHWGSSWTSHRSGWDQWNRASAPAPAPLPAYQRQYTGNRYPQASSQRAAIEQQNYRYQPQDAVARQQFQHARTQAASAPAAAPAAQPAATARTAPVARESRPQQAEARQQPQGQPRTQQAETRQQPQPQSHPPQPVQQVEHKAPAPVPAAAREVQPPRSQPQAQQAQPKEPPKERPKEQGRDEHDPHEGK